MMRLLKTYRQTVNGLGRGHTWKQFIVPFMCALCAPMSFIFLVCGVLGAFGIVPFVVDGQSIVGSDALILGLAISLVFLPAICLSAGSALYIARSGQWPMADEHTSAGDHSNTPPEK